MPALNLNNQARNRLHLISTVNGARNAHFNAWLPDLARTTFCVFIVQI